MEISDRENNIINLLAFYAHLDECERLGIIDREMLSNFFDNLNEEQKTIISLFQIKQTELSQEWSKSLNSLGPNVTRSEAVRRIFDEVFKNFEKQTTKTEK